MTAPSSGPRIVSGAAVGARKLGAHAACLFALALFGYPLVGAVISFLHVDSRTLSVPFRLVVAAVGIALLMRSGLPRGGGARSVLMFIWAAYALRLVHDTFVAQIDRADYALMFFAVAVLLPALALTGCRLWEQHIFASVSLVVSIAGCAAVLVGNMFGLFGDDDLTEATGRLTVAALDPISSGHLAVSAILCAIGLWRNVSARTRVLLIAAIGIGLATILESGSKGPALSFGVCLLAWSARRLSRRWPVPVLALPMAIFFITSGESPLASRLSASADDLSTLERVVLAQNSLTQIAGSPILGSAFVEFQSGFYPHNIVLESALALGIPLAAILIALLLYGLQRAWRAMASPVEDVLGLLYVQALVGAMVSGGMYGATMLWVTLALLLRRRTWPQRLALVSPDVIQSQNSNRRVDRASTGCVAIVGGR